MKNEALLYMPILSAFWTNKIFMKPLKLKYSRYHRVNLKCTYT